MGSQEEMVAGDSGGDLDIAGVTKVVLITKIDNARVIG
jgi:hypothetical protein